MNSLILQTTTRALVVIVFVFSIFMLLRGHNEPGGGFIAGLLVAGAFSLHLLAFGWQQTAEILRFDPRSVVAFGLLLAIGSGLWGMWVGEAFLTAQWFERPLPGIGKVGSVLVFDIGVYLVVFGAVMLIFMSLGRED